MNTYRIMSGDFDELIRAAQSLLATLEDIKAWNEEEGENDDAD